MMKDYSLTILSSDPQKALVGRLSLIVDEKYNPNAKIIQEWIERPSDFSIEPRFSSEDANGNKSLLGFQLVKFD